MIVWLGAEFNFTNHAIPDRLSLIAVGVAFVTDRMDHAVVDSEDEMVFPRSEFCEWVDMGGVERILRFADFFTIEPDTGLPHHTLEDKLSVHIFPIIWDGDGAAIIRRAGEGIFAIEVVMKRDRLGDVRTFGREVRGARQGHGVGKHPLVGGCFDHLVFGIQRKLPSAGEVNEFFHRR